MNYTKGGFPVWDEEFDKEHFEDFLTENKENIFSAFHSLKSLKNHPNY